MADSYTHETLKYEWTNSTRPSIPYNGQTGHNTDTDVNESWNGTEWVVLG